MDASVDSNGLALARQVLAWWSDAQHLTTGEYGERNLFVSEPDFVQSAREIVAGAQAPAV